MTSDRTSIPTASTGPLPPGWRVVLLGDVCEKHTGTRDPRRTPDATFSYVDISGVDNLAKRIAAAKTLRGAEAPSRARQLIRTGDVLVATTRPNLNAVALVPHELDNQICSTGFCVLRPMAEALDSCFLFAYVQSTEFVKPLSELVKGALYPAVTDSQVFAQAIPVPPLREQRRIAAIITEQMKAVERARRAIEEELETIEGIPAALLREAFSGRL
jgi:type I restriction enzyme S subunit